VTWLLDHHEVHLMLQANPDGRKQAETGLLWRKNANNEYCSNTIDRGADLNRNFDFEWACCGGSSSSQCAPTYHGPTAASEPEIQVLQDYVRSIFRDQRGPGLNDPAPEDATGVAIDVHSFSELVLWSWGFTFDPAPNAAALATFGRKLAFFNDYSPMPIRELTNADGNSADFYYGELGIAGMAYEIGTRFFESCESFEDNVLQVNIDSLLYGAKVARTPYLTPAGPEAFGATAQPDLAAAGDLVLLTATLDDTRFNNSNGTEPTELIAVAEAFVDIPPWDDAAVPLPMAASDGTFDEGVETVEGTIDTAGWPEGRHILYVRGTDTAGNQGVVAAAFLTIDNEALFFDGFESGDTSAWSNPGG
ncbi:MAG: M14 family zinc carboxypeptidase, partial [Acidobacteriota bacterium]